MIFKQPFYDNFLSHAQIMLLLSLSIILDFVKTIFFLYIFVVPQIVQ